MRLRIFAAAVALSLSSGLAFAGTPTGGGAAAGVKAAGGVIVAGAGAGGIVALTKLFSNSSTGKVMAVSKAPEISTSGTAAGLILLVGGALVLRGRQRAQDFAE